MCSAVVKLLCNHDISVLGACTSHSEFPLHLAVLLPPASRKHMVTALLESKAVPTLVNKLGLTALEIALSNGSDRDILDALHIAEARDMDNVANGANRLVPRRCIMSCACLQASRTKLCANCPLYLHL
jgi:ankyrin repeat protein